MIIVDKIYTAKWCAENDCRHIAETIKESYWLAMTAESLGLKPKDMYKVIKVGDRKWKINATPEHLAATQKFYKIV
jgi:hypothetical protein